MLVFQLCPLLNACTKNTVLVFCGLDETTATTKKHQKHDGWRVLGRRTHNNVTLCWNEVARKSSAGAFWCFVEQTNPQQIMLVLFGPDEITAKTKKHQNTENTGGGGGGGFTVEANTQHCGPVLKPMCSKNQFWCILVLRRTDEPTANCTKKQSVGAFWCFVEQTKPQQYRKSSKSMICTTSGATGRRIHNTVTLC